jgi:hypothetical protein
VTSPPSDLADMSQTSFYNDVAFATPVPDPVTGKLDPNDPAVKARASRLCPWHARTPFRARASLRTGR